MRTKPLPLRPSRGRLIVPCRVAAATISILRSFRGPDAEPHEGLVYWVGTRAGASTLILAAVTPHSDHSWGRVVADERAIGKAARWARAHELGIVAQVHSHPGSDTRHSDGDDDLVLMPSEGMFSLVVGMYGWSANFPGVGGGLHQYQDGRWVQVDPAEVDAVIYLPEMMDQRAENEFR